MNPAHFKPAHHIAKVRETVRELVKPYRTVTEADVARIIAEINTAHAIAADYEDEMLVLESMLLPKQVEPDFTGEPAKVIPIRRRPDLRLVTGGGGDAA